MIGTFGRVATYGVTMIVSRFRIVAVLAPVAAVAVLAACSSNKPGKVVTVTVPPPAATSTAATGGTTGTSGAGSGAPGSASSSAGAASHQTKLPGTCDSLLPDYAVARAAGKNTFSGKDAFVVGLPETDIHRLGYINCQYGVTGSGGATSRQLEIGVSLYASGADAAVRIPATVDDYTNHGAQTQNIKVGDLPATLLTGGQGAGYTDPLLVLAAGQRTIAVTVTKAVASGDSVATAASGVAALAVSKTAP